MRSSFLLIACYDELLPSPSWQNGCSGSNKIVENLYKMSCVSKMALCYHVMGMTIV
ncbi:hypothetical protein B4168_3120 [Anoxybacillus flavithermus]|nr:hypothetical protein B4168_3120 [Anoxybacillus flavithermus]OAO86407.1 hypothetical protein GT23_2300 [Parageobacillus thermoglucosidasius]